MDSYFDVNRLLSSTSMLASFCMIAGIVYLTTTILVIFQVMGLVSFWFLRKDPVSAFLLAIIASVYLSGVKPLRNSDREAIAFPVVGLLLSALLFFLQIATVLTNALGWILSLQDWQTWTLLMDIKPTLWTFPIIFGVFIGMVWYDKASGKTMEGSRDDS